MQQGKEKGKENCLLLLISHIHCGQGWRGKTAWTKKYIRSSWQKKPPLVYLRKKRAARRTFPKLWKMNGEKSSFSFSLAPSSWKRRLERVTKAAWILSFPADTMPPQRPSSELHHSRRYLELNNRKGSRAGGGAVCRGGRKGVLCEKGVWSMEEGKEAQEVPPTPNLLPPLLCVR